MDTKHRMSYLMSAKNQEIHVDATPLTCLINRLEAATSRLEDIASSASTYEGDATTNGAPKAPATAGKGVPEAAAGVAAAGASPTPKSLAPKPSLPPMIEDYDKNVLGDLKEYEKLSAGSTLGGLVSEQVRLTIQHHSSPQTDGTLT
jgi:adenylyl cyclase-associated protein